MLKLLFSIFLLISRFKFWLKYVFASVDTPLDVRVGVSVDVRAGVSVDVRVDGWVDVRAFAALDCPIVEVGGITPEKIGNILWSALRFWNELIFLVYAGFLVFAGRLIVLCVSVRVSFKRSNIIQKNKIKIYFGIDLCEYTNKY